MNLEKSKRLIPTNILYEMDEYMYLTGIDKQSVYHDC